MLRLGSQALRRFSTGRVSPARASSPCPAFQTPKLWEGRGGRAGGVQPCLDFVQRLNSVFKTGRLEKVRKGPGWELSNKPLSPLGKGLRMQLLNVSDLTGMTRWEQPLGRGDRVCSLSFFNAIVRSPGPEMERCTSKTEVSSQPQWPERCKCSGVGCRAHWDHGTPSP
jgi:hypothetical protein